MTSKTYIGLTIGPIVKTINRAKATRELWLSSYMFSYLMRSIVKKLQEQTNVEDKDVLDIYIEDEAISTSLAGLTPDRLTIKYSDIKQFNHVIDGVLHSFADRFCNYLHGVDADKEVRQAIRTYFKNYLQIYSVQLDITDDTNKIDALGVYLDTAEQMINFLSTEEDDIIQELYNSLRTSKKRDTFVRDIFENNTKLRILSLPELSTRGLRAINQSQYSFYVKEALKHDSNDIQNLFIPALKDDARFKEHFKTYHKYYAVVHADGDGIGSFLKGLKKNEEYKEYSKVMFEFGLEANKRIQQFGDKGLKPSGKNYFGLPVFAGGDDLLFFAPILVKRTNADGQEVFYSIFDLIDELQELYKKELSKSTLPNTQFVTMSFGVSISYHKYPLNEAVETSRKLLDDTAKKFKFEVGESKQEIKKNAVAVQVLKNSGQIFSHTFSMHEQSELFKIFKSLLKMSVKDGEKVINSVTHKLGRNPKLVQMISDDKDRIRNYIKNNFNEDIHKSGSVQRFLGLSDEEQVGNIVNLIYAAYQEVSPSKNTKQDKPLETVYGILRTLNFLKRKDNDQDEQ